MSKLETVAIARICHETNRRYCRALGDESQRIWEDAPDWQRETCIKGVEFHLANPDAGPDDSHNKWLQEKARTGWTYGEVKDEGAKTHPCFVDFDKLPPDQQAKDRLFKAIVDALR